MFGMREAFTVGVVLLAKDMYSGIVAKAERDIKTLSRTSQAEADKFASSLATWKKVGAIGVTMTMVGSQIAKFWEDAVATAGRQQSNLDRVMIAMGDSSDAMKNRLGKTFHDIKTIWGFTDEAISESLIELIGRLNNKNAALQASSVVSAFAIARNIDLASATKMLTTIYNQYGGTMDANLSVQEKYGISANKLHYVLKGLGGDWETLNMFLGGAGLKAKAAGQNFDTLMAAVKVLGMEGAKLRTAGASMDQMLDSMMKIRKKLGWEEFFPTYKKTGNLIDLLSDIRKTFERRGWMTEGFENQQKRLESLTKVFGANADMVDLFVQRFDQMKKAEQDLQALGKETGNATTYIKAANQQMETWDGTIKKFNARMEEFKEMLGQGGIPIIKAFHETVGKFTEYLGTHKTAKGILGITATVIGLSGEVMKFTGPLATLLSLYYTWRIQSTLAALAQASLTTQTTAQTAAITAQNAALATSPALAARLPAATLPTFLFGKGISLSAGLAGLLGIGTTLAGLFLFMRKYHKETEGLGVVSQRGFGWASRLSATGMKPDELPGAIKDLENALIEATKQYQRHPESRFYKNLVDQLTNKLDELKSIKPISSVSPISPPSYVLSYPELGPKTIPPGLQSLWMSGKLKVSGMVRGATIPTLTINKAELTPEIKELEKSGKIIVEKYQHGGYVPQKTLALLHPGEYVLPKSQSPISKSQSPVINLGGITINLTSSGSNQTDARTIARLLLKELNRTLKQESLRYA